jgi:hypothetical protein
VRGPDPGRLLLQIEAEQAEPPELVQQEVVGARARERADVAGHDRVDLGVGQRRRRAAQGVARGLRRRGERLAQPRLVHEAPAELVDGVDAHRATQAP